MKRTWKPIVACTALLCCLLAGSAYGVSNGEKAKVKGVIATRTGETLVVSADGGNVTVVLNDDTKVQQPKGLGLRKKQMSVTVLVPGLRITADGVGDAQNRLVAKSITFDKDDLEMAEAIQAGLTPTKAAVQTNASNIAANKQATQANAQGIQTNSQDIAANQAATSANAQAISANQQQIADTTKRFSELSEYDTKADISVNFAVGKSSHLGERQSCAGEAGEGCGGYDWLHHRREGFRRLLGQRRHESAVEHGSRPGGDCLLDPGLQGSRAAHHRTRSDGYG